MILRINCLEQFNILIDLHISLILKMFNNSQAFLNGFCNISERATLNLQFGTLGSIASRCEV